MDVEMGKLSSTIQVGSDESHESLNVDNLSSCDQKEILWQREKNSNMRDTQPAITGFGDEGKGREARSGGWHLKAGIGPQLTARKETGTSVLHPDESESYK